MPFLTTVRDHVRPLWEQAWRSTGLLLTGDPAGSHDVYAPSEETGGPEVLQSSELIVFLHSQVHQEQWISGVRRKEVMGHLVLLSRAPGQLAHVEHERVHRCEYTPDELRGSPRARNFASSVNQGTPQWDLLRRVRSDETLALRILCEAWALAAMGWTAPDGLSVTAPDCGAQWFAPFGKAPTVESAAEIARGMGRAEPAAKTLLIAAIAGGDLGAAVTAFLDGSKEA
jgi:hypothetical protein